MSTPRAAAGRVELDACLFDLDGTLLDSAELIFRSYEHAYAAHGLDVPSRSRLLPGLGRPLADQFRSTGLVGAHVEELIATYRAYNLRHHDDLVRAFPGVNAAVDDLRASGVRLGVVTSKRRDTALRGIELIGAAGWFETIVALEDTRRHKPDPEPVRVALERLGVAPERAAYVGDSPHDMASGRAAGTRVAAVGWGPFPRAAFDGVHVDAWLDGPAELARLRTR